MSDSQIHSTHSITELLHQLEAGDSLAAHQLWERARDKLIRTARRALKNLPRRVLDEEDVAITAFDAFLRGAQTNRFQKLENREDLWQILAMLADRKAKATLRRELADKRGGGRNRGESAFEQVGSEGSSQSGIGDVADPDPETCEQLPRVVREMLEGLDDDVLRRIALARLEGYTEQEISDRTGVPLRSVQRKLKIIRATWEAELSS